MCIGADQSLTGSDYPVHRHHSLPRPASNSQHTLPRNYGLSNSSRRTRSTTSPETHNGNQAQLQHQSMSLHSGYSAGTLLSSYHSNQRARFTVDEKPQSQSSSYGSEGRPHTPSRAFTYTNLSQSPRIYPTRTGPPPPLPPKGIKHGSDTKPILDPSSQANIRTGQWVLSISQGSQSDYVASEKSQSHEGGSVDGYGHETTHEQNLSDSTQASGISEPTFKRPRFACLLACL